MSLKAMTGSNVSLMHFLPQNGANAASIAVLEKTSGIRELMRITIIKVKSVFRLAFLAALIAASNPAVSQALRADQDLGAQWRVNSTARLMAGLAPWHPAHLEFAKTEAWKEHSTAMQTAWSQTVANRVKPMVAWRDKTISPTCPVGKTVLYPFSGPDFFNANWLFPDCDTFIMFGLEHPGELPNIEAMNERQIARLMTDVRAATSDLFDRNYFITENMARHLRTQQVRGVVPLLAIELAISGMDILRIVPYEIPGTFATPTAVADAAVSSGDGSPDAGSKQRPLRQLKAVAIEFRSGDSPRLKRLIYFSVDATDNGLAKYPQFVAFLRSLGPTTTLLKSASYLLHSNNFRLIRKTVLDVSGYLVQDDSGVPYGTLASSGWDVRLHGTYAVPIPPFQGAFQPALATAYKAKHPDPLPFTFGYNFRDQRDERSHMIIGVRTQQTAAATIDRPTASRTRSKPRQQRGGA
jgi:hypothetical protein